MKVETVIHAAPELCFDLARSSDFHVASTKQTSEKIVGGVTTGLMKLGDIVEFEAVHFGFRQRLSAKIVSFDRPNHFRDSQINGAFQSFDHDHFFESITEGTLMKDVFTFDCPMGFLGKIADPVVTRYLRNFLQLRGAEIKRVAECGEWRSFI